MPYSENWAGVFCVKCHQPLLVYNETGWKELISRVRHPALRKAPYRIPCSNQMCLSLAEYTLEQFVHFRVEEIPLEPQ